MVFGIKQLFGIKQADISKMDIMIITCNSTGRVKPCTYCNAFQAM